MGKATLVVMAAGIGSRFGGGIKQLEPVGPNGELIIDYSICDALKAGFNKVVFVIRRDLENDFKEVIGNRIERKVQVEYAFQELDCIPLQYKSKFPERSKPWGTGQAVLVCREIVKEPFLVINADDYYGRQAYEKAYHYLTEEKRHPETMWMSMIGFVLKNTLSENGGVTRGVCQVDYNSRLKQIQETRNIIKTSEGTAVSGDTEIDIESIVSMNMWCLNPDIFEMLEREFTVFLEDIEFNELKEEFLLPTIIGKWLYEKKVVVNVINTNEKWFGVTYKQDKEQVVKAIKKLVDQGLY